MKLVNLDASSPVVKNFVRSLPIAPEGVELELDGRVICKVIPALQLSETEKQALIAERQELIRQAQERNKDVPARVIEHEVRRAVEGVRQQEKG